MYDYRLAPGVRPEEFPHVMEQEQREGWTPEQIFQRIQKIESAAWKGASHEEPVYDIVFRKASSDISYGQMLINRYGEKLREVADILGGMRDQACINLSNDIDKFLFEGSPSDM